HLISERVELTDQTNATAQLRLTGLHVHLVLMQAEKQFPFLRPASAGGPVFHAATSDALGMPGYDFFCTPGHASPVWAAFISAGPRPAGLQAYELLRVEAGTPVYGKDIDEERFVVELDRAGRAISYTKGCYLGQEPIVVARDRGHVNRHFRGVLIRGNAPL